MPKPTFVNNYLLIISFYDQVSVMLAKILWHKNEVSSSGECSKVFLNNCIDTCLNSIPLIFIKLVYFLLFLNVGNFI